MVAKSVIKTVYHFYKFVICWQQCCSFFMSALYSILFVLPMLVSCWCRCCCPVHDKYWCTEIYCYMSCLYFVQCVLTRRQIASYHSRHLIVFLHHQFAIKPADVAWISKWICAITMGEVAEKWGAGSWNDILPFALFFGGCMSSMISMEYILNINPKAGNLVTFTEFIFVLLKMSPGFVGWDGLKSRKASDRSHLVHAVVYAKQQFLWISIN